MSAHSDLGDVDGSKQRDIRRQQRRSLTSNANATYQRHFVGLPVVAGITADIRGRTWVFLAERF
jgi:hypothetical protein